MWTVNLHFANFFCFGDRRTLSDFINRGKFITTKKVETFTVFLIIQLVVNAQQNGRASVINSVESLTTGECTRNFRYFRTQFIFVNNNKLLFISHEKYVIFNSILSIHFVTICVAHFKSHTRGERETEKRVSVGQGSSQKSVLFRSFSHLEYFHYTLSCLGSPK